MNERDTIRSTDFLCPILGGSLPIPPASSDDTSLMRKPIRDLPLWLVAALLGLLGVGLRWGSAYLPRLADLPRTLGDAFFVAAILTVTFEVFAQRRLIREVGDDLAGKLVGWGLPTRLQELVAEVVQAEVVMSDYVKTYQFTKIADDTVVIDIEIRYKVKNFSFKGQRYAPTYDEDRCNSPEVQTVTYGLGDDEHTFDSAHLQSGNYLKEENDLVRVAGLPQIELPPRQHADVADECRVLWQCRIRMPIDYTEITSFGRPVDEVEISWKPSPEFEFRAHGEKMRHEPDSPSWKFPCAFIAGQHVRVWWKPVQKKGAPDA